MSPSDFASISGAIFAGVSALIAAMAIYLPARTQASQRLLDQAQLSLERAYEALSSEGRHVGPPAADRLNWLTSARHIERYKALKGQLVDKVHLLVCEEQEEYWRHRIYLCLATPQPLPTSYYQERLQPEPKAAIHKTSALVIHAFAKWPEGRADPLDAVNANELIEGGRVLQGKPGLRAYIEEGATG